MAQTKLVKIDDDIYENLKQIAGEKGMNPGSIIAMMFTYPCSICKKTINISLVDFDEALEAKTKALSAWAHKGCIRKRRESEQGK